MRGIRFIVRGLWRMLRQPEPMVLVALLVVVLGVLAFAKIADDVSEREADRFDQRVLRSLRQPNHPAELRGPAWLGEAARDFSALGGVTVLVFVTLTVAVFLLLAGHRRTMWLVLLSAGSGVLLTTALKHIFARPRPHVVPHLDVVSSYSFPSGHSMLSAVVYLTLGALLAGLVGRWRLKVYIVVVATLVALLVGISRVLLGVHYPTDVLGGWTAGVVWAMLWWVFGHYAAKHRTPKSE